MNTSPSGHTPHASADMSRMVVGIYCRHIRRIRETIDHFHAYTGRTILYFAAVYVVGVTIVACSAILASPQEGLMAKVLGTK